MYKALFIESSGEAPRVTVRDVSIDKLPQGDVVVSVLFSGLNYKDGLAVTGKGKIIQGTFPFIPGIDLVGEVIISNTPQFIPGDLVIATGWGMGEQRWGGYSQVQRIEGSHLLPVPEGMDTQAAMIIGTAGLTAMLSVMALENHGVSPEKGDVVVTGASGGVGSFAVALLASKGFQVVASTGSGHAHEYLRRLGANKVIDRSELGKGPRRSLDTGCWAGAVDTVGGRTLSTLFSQTKKHGSIAACGLVGGHQLETTVYPFILRGINLLGIDSNTCPSPVRYEAWDRLSKVLSAEIISLIKSGRIPLDSVPEYANKILNGTIQGRLVVDVNV